MSTVEPPPATQHPAPDAPTLLRTYLADRSEPCPNCEYDLRGLTGDTCPECGLELVLRVGLAEPRQAAFITGLIGLAASAGFSGLVAVYLLIALVRTVGFGGYSYLANEFVVITSGLVVSTGTLALWLKLRRWLRARTPMVRWVAVIGAWLLPFANLALCTIVAQS